eukprot:TRINITY_DN1572_c0_g1_i3.p1 TRINITY_DN1572_c0_g1~~TRINITY_DN1572_c0_g1_i3.p1  ORF type:complete len:851 (-),score=139.88 TRINITY_DN1572_c0_g1_i3:150-2702(-)
MYSQQCVPYNNLVIWKVGATTAANKVVAKQVVLVAKPMLFVGLLAGTLLRGLRVHGLTTSCGSFQILPANITHEESAYWTRSTPALGYTDSQAWCRKYAHTNSFLPITPKIPGPYSALAAMLVEIQNGLNFWTGLNKTVPNANSSAGWVWQDGVPESERPAPWNIATGEPNGGLSESCVLAIYEEGYVFDVGCVSPFTIICQILLSDCPPFDCPVGSCVNNFTGSCHSQVPPGFHGSAAESCLPCQAGKFSSSPGQSSCISCTDGSWTFRMASSSCPDCLPGSARNVSSGDCFVCPKGTASVNQSTPTSCYMCEPGTYAPTVGSLKCINCPSGKFSSSAGQDECENCGFGFYVTSDFTSCESCPPGRYSDTATAAYCTACPPSKWSNKENASSASTCKACPTLDIVFCGEGTSIPIVDGEGYYRNLSDPGIVLPCIPANSCARTGNSSTVCDAAYTGFKCSECNSDFFRSGGRCLRCMPAGLRWLIIISSIIVFLFVLSKASSRQEVIPLSFRMALFWYQFLSLYPSLSSSWPPVLLSILNFANFFNLDIGYIGIGCDVILDYLSILRIKILMPLGFVLFVIVQNYIVVLMKKGRKLNLLRICSQAIFISNFFSIQLLSSMFQIFNCVDSGDVGHQYVLSQNPSIVCFSTTWIGFVVFDSFFILLYLVLVPLGLIFFYIQCKKYKDEKSFKSFFKPLTKGYRDGVEWFELVKFLFRLVFVLLRDTLRLEGNSKILFLVVLLVILVWIESHAHPYEEQAQQDLSIMWSLICVILLASNSVFQSTADARTLLVVTSFLVAFLLGVTLLTVFNSVRQVVMMQKSGVTNGGIEVPHVMIFKTTAPTIPQDSNSS